LVYAAVKKFIYFTSIACLLLFWGCNQIQKVTDAITKPTARELYERDFEKEDPTLLAWKTAYKKSLKDTIKIPLPYTESGVFSSRIPLVYSYNILLHEGERLLVLVDTPVDSLEVFIDVFQKKDSVLKAKPEIHAEPGESYALMDVKETSEYKVVIQPEIIANVPFAMRIYTQPSYIFPVQDAANKNIQSLWGASRDAGRRSHEGVDIFADRGTPVIAVSDGRVNFSGERGLGGKQVWLRDKRFGSSVYYAHLDSILVHSGQRVSVGDTLGLVGNSGNARTTTPHLHFGIYKGYSGAIDPLPFIRMRETPSEETSFENSFGSINQSNAELRMGPSTKYMQLSALSVNDSVRILGRAGNWYHIQAQDSLKGFIHGSLLNILEEN
jgi:murein DD-endopeptidase MepM/ murein hydrolase activator NlpD